MGIGTPKSHNNTPLPKPIGLLHRVSPFAVSEPSLIDLTNLRSC